MIWGEEAASRPCGCVIDPWVFGHRHYAGSHYPGYSGWPPKLEVPACVPLPA